MPSGDLSRKRTDLLRYIDIHLPEQCSLVLCSSYSRLWVLFHLQLSSIDGQSQIFAYVGNDLLQFDQSAFSEQKQEPSSMVVYFCRQLIRAWYFLDLGELLS